MNSKNSNIKIYSLYVSILLAAIFLGCKDDTPPGGHSYPLFKNSNELLLLKSDATPFEVKPLDSNWKLGAIEVNGEIHQNTYAYTTGITLGQNIFRDTMSVKWIEVYKLSNIIKVKPHHNTTGTERNLKLHLWAPPSRYNATLHIIQPAE
ncbi:MAG: hypothetical protein LBI82_00480 [Dysgonamonadaceae bacterium]|jgi:hypothetical protein|nr:hypothetical protein [Dysgonamonadaceae bacterium]